MDLRYHSASPWKPLISHRRNQTSLGKTEHFLTIAADALNAILLHHIATTSNREQGLLLPIGVYLAMLARPISSTSCDVIVNAECKEDMQGGKKRVRLPIQGIFTPPSPRLRGVFHCFTILGNRIQILTSMIEGCEAAGK